MAEVAETKKYGYYTQDTGGGDVWHYFMGAEPPEEQYIYIWSVKAWEPLIDRWYLMDMIIDGNPEITGPVPNPPEGVTPAPSGSSEPPVAPVRPPRESRPASDGF